MKALVAYRSISHMNYSTLVIMLFSSQGDRRGSLLILRHRFVSSVLFMVAGRCLHSLGRRLVYFLKRALVLKEAFLVVLFFVTMGNLSIPPLLRLWGELLSLGVGLRSFWLVGVPLCVYFLLVSYYSLFLSLSFVGKEGGVFVGDRTQGCAFVVSVSLLDFFLLNLY